MERSERAEKRTKAVHFRSSQLRSFQFTFLVKLPGKQELQGDDQSFTGANIGLMSSNIIPGNWI